MIKVGIIGAQTQLSGEILRILFLHPEVDIVTLFSPELTGRSVSSVHHGFIGEKIVNFTDKIDLSDLDIIFLTDDSEVSNKILTTYSEWPDLRIVDITPSRFSSSRNEDFEYGLSEINRKALVRGARKAFLPSAIAATSLIALYPLASFLLLPNEIDIDVEAPASIVNDTMVSVAKSEIKERLEKVQTSFKGDINISTKPFESSKIIKVKISFECKLSIEEIYKVYMSIYDDHNFTFVSMTDVDDNEVVGTQKCVLTIKKPVSDRLEIVSLADANMRGGAGDAVHMLNLLFALYEKIGLHLKPSA